MADTLSISTRPIAFLNSPPIQRPEAPRATPLPVPDNRLSEIGAENRLENQALNVLANGSIRQDQLDLRSQIQADSFRNIDEFQSDQRALDAQQITGDLAELANTGQAGPADSALQAEQEVAARQLERQDQQSLFRAQQDRDLELANDRINAGFFDPSAERGSIVDVQV